MSPELIDTVRYGHLLSFGLGIGAACMADMHVARFLRRPISRHLLTNLHLCHTMIWVGLTGMWITGAMLIYVRTGFVLDNVTPKLWSKLGIVSILTVNAFLIGRIALPQLRQWIGRSPIEVPWRVKLVGGMLSSFSMASWLLALALGSSKVLASGGWQTFAILVPLTYAIFGLSALCVVAVLHRFGKPQFDASAPETKWIGELVS
ncbi:MAG: hypothetical protein ABJD13_18040 [Paracoccaceae bacterium]